MKKITANPKIYSFAEALADISYIAGTVKFYGGNSREDIDNFIEWAEEFERVNKGAEWGITEGMDYIDAITEFTDRKLKEHAPEIETQEEVKNIIESTPDTLKVEIMYRDGANYKDFFDHEINLVDYPEAIDLKAGDTFEMGGYGTLSEQEYFEGKSYNKKYDHNILEIVVLK